MTTEIKELKERARRLHELNAQNRAGKKSSAIDLANLGGEPGERRSLSHRQWLFIVYWLKGLSGTQAAIKAGYSKRSAASQASYLMRNKNVLAAMDVMREALLDNAEVSIDRLMEELWDTALAHTDIKGSDKMTATKLLLDYLFKVTPSTPRIQEIVVRYEDAPQVLDIEDADWSESESDA